MMPRETCSQLCRCIPFSPTQGGRAANQNELPLTSCHFRLPENPGAITLLGEAKARLGDG